DLIEQFTPDAPMCPTCLEDTGLSLNFLCDMVLKTMFTRGSMIGVEMARALCIPFKILDEALAFLKDTKCIEIAGGELIGTASYRFNLTDFGRQRARDAIETNGYVGPCPVPMVDYVRQCYRQKVTGIPITRRGLMTAFSGLVITDDLIDTIGPAVVSGKAIFVYGPPGTGKTTIAKAVGDYMNNSGGDVFIPYAVKAEEGVITLYDPIVHRPADSQADDVGTNSQALIRRLLNEQETDPRWVKIRRPVIITGGELNLGMLDLKYTNTSNVYQAPLHIKANGGIFLIDDFGRQLCTPKELLNRWIFPLEDRHDFLTIASGKKFMVPFEQLIIFSTNLDPKDLVDDAFLRRMRHKLRIDAPGRDVYEQIFKLYCRKLKLNECPEAIDFMFETYYDTGKRITRPSDCRDLLEIVVSICRFKRETPFLTRDLIVEAARQFISEF
ncbi:MAG: AAA family ATPase, partial [Planctomycetia bacterium]